jgi:hypothetical protein
MGCDIHAIYEKKGKYGWVNAGDPEINRNYTIFSIVGNVRNYDGKGIQFIAENRINPKDENLWWDYSAEFRALSEGWNSDGHSHSYVTLKELKEYDITQKYFSNRLITGKDKDGKITGTCASTNGEHLGKVGETSIFGVWGSTQWDELIAYGEDIRERFGLNDEDVRLVFFFDN